jgi:hypothetical protein
VDDLVASIVGSTPVSGSVDKMNESPSASAASGTLSDFHAQQRYRPTLKEETVSVFDIAPREKISYEKEVQVRKIKLQSMLMWAQRLPRNSAQRSTLKHSVH